MVLHNLQLVNTNRVIDIQVAGKLISKVSNTGTTTDSGLPNLTFEHAVVLPGLINSHDHLDFNLFPQLGAELYNNYTEWARHIHKAYKHEIAAVLRIPKDLRVQWGVYKNLLCGVTTVVNHGEALPQKDYIITVLQNSQSLHSVAFERQLKLKLNNLFRIKEPVAIHVGEGVDEFALREMDHLIKWNLFKRKVVAIHGVTMTVEQAKQFHALVWCPSSNYFMFNKTADIHQLKKSTAICFGSDSTLTSSWNIWEHIRLAKRKSGIFSDELLQMLTIGPAKVWQINGGVIEDGRDADLIVAKAHGENLLFDIGPENILLVIHKGQVRLFDDSLIGPLRDTAFALHSFSPVEINNHVKYVKGNIQQLLVNIKRYFPSVQLPIKSIQKAVAE